MGKRRFKLKTQNQSFSLNITSMTDMFTILLVFLLQNYSTSEVQIPPDKDINLPISNVEVTPHKTLNLSVSRTEIKIEGRTIASLQDGNFITNDLEAHDPSFIKPLFAELDKIEKDPKQTENKEGKILLQADASLSYQTLRKVMYTASMAGFPKLKIATITGD
jgi:biopolymer transport protein ExbD